MKRSAEAFSSSIISSFEGDGGVEEVSVWEDPPPETTGEEEPCPEMAQAAVSGASRRMRVFFRPFLMEVPPFLFAFRSA